MKRCAREGKARLRCDGTAGRDGALVTVRGACRFAVLRAELTVGCAEGAAMGDVRFDGDDKLIWRHERREAIVLAPVD